MTKYANVLKHSGKKGMKWGHHVYKSADAGTENKKTQDVRNDSSKSNGKTKKLSKIVSKVINGDFGNGSDRFKKLTKAGYDWKKVQNLVNKKLGSSVRH